MRQLTVGTSESPHVIHITSKGDILQLLNFFYQPGLTCKLCPFPDRLS